MKILFNKSCCKQRLKCCNKQTNKQNRKFEFEVVVAANAPKYSVDSHYCVCQLKKNWPAHRRPLSHNLCDFLLTLQVRPLSFFDKRIDHMGAVTGRQRFKGRCAVECNEHKLNKRQSGYDTKLFTGGLCNIFKVQIGWSVRVIHRRSYALFCIKIDM